MKTVDEKKVRSDLIMKDLFFSTIEFHQNKDANKVGRIDLQINYHLDMIEKTTTEAEIVFGVTIKDAEERINLRLVANGIFEIGVELPANVTKEMILKNNAVAIMFPFIRSQVSLITTQPGLAPVMLQPINIAQIWAQK